ncbi:MAG: NUDIX domain-containing protein [Bacilli bacterium]
MEILDIVDEQLKYIRKIKRCDYDKLNKNEYFLYTHIWVIKDQEILIQKRSLNRKWAPGMWATHTGTVISGETPRITAIRELKEEINLEINDNQLINELVVYPSKIYNLFKGIGYIYFVKCDNIDILIDNKEVIDYKYVSLDKLKAMIASKKFINYGRDGIDYENYFKTIFEIIEGLMVNAN